MSTPRITVVEHVYYQRPGEPVTGPEPARFSRKLAGDDQPVDRTVKLEADWRPLDTFWLESAGHLVLHNSTKRIPGKVPTEEERAEFESRIIEWGVTDSDGEVIVIGTMGPGETARFSPRDPGAIRVRCLAGKAKLTYYMVPG